MVTIGMAHGPERASPTDALFVRAGMVSGGQLQLVEGGRETVPSGFRAVDSLLPSGGVRRGSLVELLVGDDATGDVAGGGGALTLACAVACRLAHGSRNGHDDEEAARAIVVVDRGGWFHPPGMLPWADGRRLVVARPSRDDDELWAIDQALRSPGVAAVVAWPRHGRTTDARRTRGGHGLRQWSVAMRRWQLAARSSGTVGLFVRPGTARREPSWAEARFAVVPLPGGTLFERRMRLMDAGGGWLAADPAAPPSADLVLDLARGREATAWATAAGPVPHALRPDAREVVGGSVTCRAS